MWAVATTRKGLIIVEEITFPNKMQRDSSISVPRELAVLASYSTLSQSEEPLIARASSGSKGKRKGMHLMSMRSVGS